jgi:signal transduction histidine kinase/CheY-like chemotaxis protein
MSCLSSHHHDNNNLNQATLAAAVTSTMTTSSSSSSSSSSSFSKGTPYFASHADLEILNLIHQPIWVFDVVRRSMFWANPAALELWNAPTLESLLQRSFKEDMSESTQMRLDAHMEKFLRNESVQEQWTFYPQGQQAVVVDCCCTGITVEEGRMVMLVQGTKQVNLQNNEQQKHALRATEMIRHLPVAVCMTDLEGNILEQNPESMAVFGKENVSQQQQQQQTLPLPSFVNRFVDPKLGMQILQQAAKGDQDVVNVQAEQTTVFGEQWSSIKIRKTRDPVTSNPVLLCATRDITDIVKQQHQQQPATTTTTNVAKQNLAKLQDLADAANAMRTPLQHVLGVVELLSKQQQRRRERSSSNNNNSSSSSSTLVKRLEGEAKNSNVKNSSNNKNDDEDDDNDTRSNLDDCLSVLHQSATLLATIIENFTNAVSPKLQSSRKCWDDDDDDERHLGDTTAANTTIESSSSSRPLLLPPLPTCSGHSKNSMAPLDVRKVVEQAVQAMIPQAQAKDLSIRLNMYSRSIKNRNHAIVGDSIKLQDILQELLQNAVKNTPSHGRVVVAVRRVSNTSTSTTKRYSRIRFEVKDSGVGMNLEQQRQCLRTVLQQQQQQNEERLLLKEKQYGTHHGNHRDDDDHDEEKEEDPTTDSITLLDDLTSAATESPPHSSGLQKCKALVDSMGGIMGVTSKPGQGSLFWVEIPFSKIGGGQLVKKSVTMRQRKRRTNDTSSLSSVTSLPLETVMDVEGDGGLNILLVDDQDVSGRNVMKALLEEFGHTVTVVPTGDAMIQSVVQGGYDVVLLETQVNSFAGVHSRYSALEATMHLRKNLCYSPETLPIVALTAAVPRPDYQDLGLNDWLTKPVLVKDIQQAITNAICNLGRSTSGSTIGSPPNNDDSTICSSPSLMESLALWENVERDHDTSTGNITRSMSSKSAKSGLTDTVPIMPKRGSLNSIHTLLSDHVL